MEIIVEGSTIYNGDCLEVMDTIDKCSVDSIVTDPPYHLTSIVQRFGKEGSAPAQFGTDGAFARASKGFMGKEWDGGDIAFQANTWRKCYELLKPGGHLIAFSGSRTYHRMAVAIEDAGFEIRDQCIWLYGSGFPKSHNIGREIDKKQGNDREVVGEVRAGKNALGQDSGWNKHNNRTQIEITKGNSEWEGWGTALKPAHEPMVLARKPLSEKSVADNVMKHGTGAINIDGCRIEGQSEDTERKKVVRKARSTDGVWTDDNSGMKSEGSEYADADPRGRWPSNIMHDGSEQVQDIFPETSSTEVSRERTHKGIWSAGELAESEQLMPAYGDQGNASRYFYCAKTSKEERNFGLHGFKNQVAVGMSGRSDGSLGSITMNKNVHPTVKPVELMRYLVRLVTPKGGLVLDPFMGSGSTGMGAREEDFRFVGIEKEEEYYEIAKARIKNVKPQLKLFDI
jgi:site-specific DNA-methyltransferase (adenine-specific)